MPWSLIRYGGLAGAVLLSGTAYLGGVSPVWQPGVTPATIWQGPHGPVVLLGWLVGTALLVAAWWAGRDRVPSARWVAVTVGLWLLPLLVAPPLGSRDVYSYACQGAAYAAGADPYAGGVADAGCPWLEAVSPAWRDTPAPYGPLFILVAGVAAAAGGSLLGTVALLRLAALLGVVLTAFCLPALARHAGVDRDRALWLVLACPVVAIHLVSGAHNDALMVGLMVAGLRVVLDRPGRVPWLLAGGALLGLAVSVKVTAVVVVPFAMLAAVPGAYRWWALARYGAAVPAGAVAAVLAVTGLSGLGAGWVHGLARSGDSVQWTSLPTAVGLALGYLGRPFGAHWEAVAVARTVGLGVLALLLVAIWWRALRGSPLRGAGLALAATVVLSPVFHPWYAIWPLAVLAAAGLPARWLTAPAAVASLLALPDGTNLARFTKFPGTLAMSAGLVVVVIVAVRRMAARVGG
ncbi:polyprenol phosphomannose-dependent alpha 1,6 mannosyltransferase MptB [Plantactinospora sp. WMMB334]|uniref:polyprenol phosphomannose-dependent alpha 1,6 mannosyltransferase MptB n=1 Tax=Plantactinospora sp. WMMB334 TaxID=3404119 RepID=UPI003B95B461